MIPTPRSGVPAPWLDRSRLHLYVGSLAVALWVGWLVFVLLSTGATAPTGRVGGDFPAFWGAGQLVLEGRADLLWDRDAQMEAQRSAFPEPGSIVPFPYAPPVALAFAPLATLPYLLAYVVYTMAMAGLTWLSVIGLVRLNAGLAEWRWLALLAALAFPPLYRASTQGQNTAVVLCLLVWGFVALQEERPVLAGLLLGVLWFKPTYAVPLTCLLLVERRFKVGATIGGVLAIGWALSAIMIGPRWLSGWVEGAAEVQTFNFEANLGSSVSLVELVWESLPGVVGAASGAATLTLLALATLHVWRRSDDWPSRMALVTMATLALAPHAYWYDLGLMLAPLAYIASRPDVPRAWLLSVPFAATLPVLVDLRLGPLWVALVCYFAFVIARTAARPELTTRSTSSSA